MPRVRQENSVAEFSSKKKMFSSDAAQHFIQPFPPLIMLQLIDLNLNGADLTPEIKCKKMKLNLNGIRVRA